MPVLSPHRSSSSGLSGSYRPTYTSAFDRSYYGGSRYSSPRVSSYSERISTRTYTDPDGRCLILRSGSITENGVTTRFTEESREGSLSRDSGISSIRESSILDLPPRRDSSQNRRDRISASNIIDSITELRNKYSAANYIPEIQRKKYENIPRSKSINDIGLPRSDTKTNSNNITSSLNRKKQVTSDNTIIGSNIVIVSANSINANNGCTNNASLTTTTTNSNSSSSSSRNNIVPDLCDADANGNRRTSVADLCKRFDEKPSKFNNRIGGSTRVVGGRQTNKRVTTSIEDTFRREASSTPPSSSSSSSSSPSVTIANKKSSSPSTSSSAICNGSAVDLASTTASSSSLNCNGHTSPTAQHQQQPLSSNGVLDHTSPTAATPSPNSKIANGELLDDNNGVVLQATNNKSEINGIDSTAEKESSNDTQQQDSTNTNSNNMTNGGEERKRGSRVNQCASFIPNEPGGDQLDSENEKIGRKHSYDISPSPSNSGTKGRGLSSSTAPTSSSSSTGGGGYRRSLASSSSDGGHIDDLAQLRRGSSADPQRNVLGLIGLRNIGNTCFMNSVLQCLSNTHVLLDYIRKDHYQRDINNTTSAMKGSLIKAFAEVIKELWSPNSSSPVNTAALKAQIQRFAPRFMGYSQQDAQEFLRYLLEGLHEDVNRVTSKPKPITTDIDDNLSDKEKSCEAWRRYLRAEDSYIVDMFVGQLKSTLKCTHCGHCSVTFDPFWDLSLPLPSGRNSTPLRLAHALEAFTKEETLDGDEKPTCAKCKERRRCTKSFSIQKFPQVLVIHLKRFSPLERFRGKLNTLVDFPLEGLDLTQYAAEPQSGPSPKYNLYAVSEHSGTPYSGHYTAHCKNPMDNRWYEYNDSRILPSTGRSAVSPEAYVLFYERDGGGVQKSRL